MPLKIESVMRKKGEREDRLALMLRHWTNIELPHIRVQFDVILPFAPMLGSMNSSHL